MEILKQVVLRASMAASQLTAVAAAVPIETAIRTTAQLLQRPSSPMGRRSSFSQQMRRLLLGLRQHAQTAGFSVAETPVLWLGVALTVMSVGQQVVLQRMPAKLAAYRRHSLRLLSLGMRSPQS
jgi:precorrin-4 methylase